MIGNGLELYFRWRKTFDVMIKKKCKGHIFLQFDHTFVPISKIVEVYYFSLWKR